jgi:hypothetical protein
MEDQKIAVTIVPQNITEPIGTPKEKTITHTNKKEAERINHLLIAFMGTGGVLVWIILFSLGMLIDSTHYRDILKGDFNLSAFMMTVLTFTPTNIAMLCLVSSFNGGCASLLIIAKAEKALGFDKQNHTKTSSHIYMSENPFSSMLRGIVVFFAFLAGVFVTSSTALTTPTAQAYTQAAGIVSLLSFIVGYDPTMFRTLISIGEKLKLDDSEQESK